MKSRNIVLALLLFVFSFLSFSSTLAQVPQWAKSVVNGSDHSKFNSVAVDQNGNVYAAGRIFGNSTYDFGNGVTVSGSCSDKNNAVLVKYDSSGNVQWAKRVVNGYGWSSFKSVAVDLNGNVYSAGYIFGNYVYDFGNGVTVSVSCSGKSNIVLVKYDSIGNAQWVKSVVSGMDISTFDSVAVDSSGCVYGAGYIFGGTFDFGNGVTVVGDWFYDNIVLVKYDSNGDVQWARSAFVGQWYSHFRSVAVDLSGNVYVAGYIYYHTLDYDFGNNVTVAAVFSGPSVVLVKYDSNGNAQWAKSVVEGSDDSWFNSVAVDSSGNVYAAGYIRGYGILYDFGNGVTVVVTHYKPRDEAVLVKYDSNGNTQWAKGIIGGDHTKFNSVAVDLSGNVYVAGRVDGNVTFYLGNGVTVAGVFYEGENILLVKYNSSGDAQWAESVVGGLDDSGFNSVAVDSSGNVYAAGYISGTGAYDFGDGVTVSGNSSDSTNIVLVKYGDNTNFSLPSPSLNVTPTIIPTGTVSSLSPGITPIPTLTPIVNSTSPSVTATPTSTAGLLSPSPSLNVTPTIIPTGTVSSLSQGITPIPTLTPIVNSPSPSVTPTPTSTAGLLSPSSSPSITPTITPTAISSSLLSVRDVNKSGYKNDAIVFTLNDFLSNFIANDLGKIKIMSLPSFGVLKLYGTDVNVNQEIDVADLDNLVYVPEVNWVGDDGFIWVGLDGTKYVTNPVNVNIKINADEDTIERVETIIGIASGSVTLCATFIGAMCWCYRRYHKKQLGTDIESKSLV